MKYLCLSFLAVFTAWSVLIVREDLASGKIPNVRIITGGKLLLAALTLLMINSYLGYGAAVPSFLKWNFYPMWAAHVCWAALAGVILWYSEVWPAGDAKFFILTAAWLPLINPFLKNFPDYLFLSLLVNIFVAAGLATVGNFIASGFAQASPADFFSEVRADLGRKISELAGAGQKNKWLPAAYLANTTFLFLFQQVLNAESRHFLSRFFSRTDLLFFFLFFMWDKISNAFGSRKWLYAVMAGYAVYFFSGYFLFYDRLVNLLLYSMVNVLKFSFILVFGRLMLGFLMEKKDLEYAGAAEIAPGMILSAKALASLRGNEVFDGAFDDCFKDGISAEQAGLIKDWLARLAAPDPKIEIVKGRPFALWIFAGAVITLLLDRNLAGLLK